MPTSPFAMSVYLVEDSEPLASRLAELLQDDLHMHVAGRAADSETAIAEIDELHPDVVLLDLTLRSGTRFDVLRALRKQRSAPICIVLTNHSAAAYKRAAEQLGVSPDRFFDKTEQLTSMARYIQRLAENRSTSLESGGGSIGRDNEQRDGHRSLQGPRRTHRA